MPKSKIFLLLVLSFISGIFLYSFVKTPPIVTGGVFVLGLGVLGRGLFGGKNRLNFREKMIFGSAILFLALGIWRSESVMSRGIDNPDLNAQKTAVFIGRVVGEPDRRSDFSQYVLTPTPIGVGAPTVSVGEKLNFGRVLIRTGLYPEYFYGDVLKISGEIAAPENFSGFDYKNYLAKDDIFLLGRNPEITLISRPAGQNLFGRLLIFKKSFTGNINKILNEPQASFLSALLVGLKRSLPADLTEALSRTGTSHIVAISGYNISIIGLVLFNFLGYLLLPRRLIFWLTGIVIVLFTLIAGAEASVVRAAIMGGLLILARREGRFYRATNAVILAAAIMLFWNPRLLRYDAGFELSFLATIGLIYLSPRFNHWFRGLPDFLSFRTNLATTLSAQIMTLPVIFWTFGRISPVAVLANVLILPAIPPTMFFGFLGGLAGFVSLKAAAVMIVPAWLLLSYQIWVVKFLSLVPFASL